MKVRKWTQNGLSLTRGGEHQSLLKMVRASNYQKSKFHFPSISLVTHFFVIMQVTLKILKKSKVQWLWLAGGLAWKNTQHPTNFENCQQIPSTLYRMENPAVLRVIRGMSWNGTGIFLFSSQGRKAETDQVCGQQERCAGKLGYWSRVLERAVFHHSGCTSRGLFLRVGRRRRRR